MGKRRKPTLVSTLENIRLNGSISDQETFKHEVLIKSSDEGLHIIDKPHSKDYSQFKDVDDEIELYEIDTILRRRVRYNRIEYEVK